LLVRGGTTSVGLAAAAIARQSGAHVIATTRNPAKSDALRVNGADEVIVDTGNIVDSVREASRGGVDKVLELIGTTTLADSLRCAKPQGVVCMMGMVGNKWSFDDFSPMEVIPSTVRLTTYDGGVAEFMETPYTKLLEQVEQGSLRLPVGSVYGLEQIVEAHRAMEENRAGGKIVVLA
jgi:NADPH:quinone reductase-like Zn-dependent oxidoreductase